MAFRHRATSLLRCPAQRGLTFGEMLIVMAVFLILAVIFMFSSQTAMVKTRLSRVLQDQKQVARAIDAYSADHGSAPNEGQYHSALDRGYLDHIPNDPFAEQRRSVPRYQYFANISNGLKWVIVSVGPDGVPDVEYTIQDLRGTGVSLAGIQPGQKVLMSDAEARQFIIENSYDPTNGTVSRGDLITVGQ